MKSEYYQDRVLLESNDLEVSTGILSMVSRILFPGSLSGTVSNFSETEAKSEPALQLESTEL
ncbi:hypothetical protein [Leptospira stimsonii]|uniref:Uncharacterized protein n=1 Tax=Leptospira stimsonii TaxID=2202203 RepID=A0ABY2N3E5_9LEPT|nr:hypothetical protein [Leptospira stimsonii]TGK22835.1 hypothetical protein EHO98_06020 [Leptospira stimsonii]TGM15007.1 hypothetical protein EHQ90_11065 [Leptospira stimsonii]